MLDDNYYCLNSTLNSGTILYSELYDNYEASFADSSESGFDYCFNLFYCLIRSSLRRSMFSNWHVLILLSLMNLVLRELNLFFIICSLLFHTFFDISDHFGPSCSIIYSNWISSSMLHLDFTNRGLRWLIHLSRQIFGTLKIPLLTKSLYDINLQFIPYYWIAFPLRYSITNVLR